MDYYVAQNGSDANPGTLAAPWASIAKGVDLYNPGDTLYVRAGTYAPAHALYFYRSGSTTAPITFRAYPGETVVLDGANMSSGANVVYISAPYFVMQDFEIKNGKLNGVTVENTSHVTLLNCKVHDSQHSGIYVGKGDMTSTHDITVDSCSVYNNVHMNDAHTLDGGWSGALVAGGAVNVTFKNNTVYKNQGEGIIFYLADRCSALNNVSHDNFGVNLYLDNATNCTAAGNFLYCSGDATYFTHGLPATGIQHANEQYNISNPSTNNTIVNNIFVKNNYAFYYGNYGIGGALKNFTFANNSIYLSNREMLHIDSGAHSNATFCNNISFQSNGGAQVVLPSSMSGLSFSHNLWYGGDVGAAWTTGDIYADPLFVNPGTFVASDYKLKSGTPAAGTGVPLSSVTNDFFGLTRTQPADIGASIADTQPASPPPTEPPDPPEDPTPPSNPPSTGPLNAAPVVSSAPTATPNPATAGQIVTLTAAATDADNDPLVYTWDFGDGTSAAGASVEKVYSYPGTFGVTVTVSDGQANAVAIIMLTVNAPALPPPPPPPPENLVVSSISMNFDLSKASGDALYVLGTIELPAGFRPAGASTVISVGNYQRTVTLNSRGVSTDRTFRLAGSMARGAYTATKLNFLCSVKRAALFAQIPRLSNLNGTHTQDVNVSLAVGANYAAANATMTYTVVGGK